MKELLLNNGHVTLLDDDDYERFAHLNWRAKDAHKSGVFYVERMVLAKEGLDKKYESLHREIMKAPKGMYVDHINHNTLDNRKENLRLCTGAQNTFNRRKPVNNTTGYKGVSKYSYGYSAAVMINKKTHYLGSYPTAEEAAKVYDAKAKELFGEFACLNFKDSDRSGLDDRIL